MDRIFKRTKGEKQIRMGYGIAFLLLITAYAITFFANRRMLNQSAMVEHTNKVIANLEIMLSSVKDAEAGVRGYVITQDTGFLSTYYGSSGKTYPLYYEVLRLTADNPEQQQRLKQLKNNLDKRYDLFLSTLRAFYNSNRTINDTLIQVQLEAKKIMNEIRQGVLTIQNEEKALLLFRTQRLKKTFSYIKMITVTSVVIAFLLIIFGFITYIRENKGRKRAMKEVHDYEQQLKNRIEELNNANMELIRMRGQEKFAATGRIARTIAHEVRNPLTNINLAADQLKSEIAVKDETSAMLFDIINRNSARINQLISDLLISTKFSELRYEKVRVNQLLDEALEEAGDRIALANVTVVKKHKSDIGYISADKEKIKIAFLNIIINALEAMENNEHRLLTLETIGGNKCKIIIRDNGCGMDSDTVSRLFEPYFTGKPKGNGLGLVNTQNIILNHKGEISVETAKGKGTSFIIELDFAS